MPSTGVTCEHSGQCSMCAERVSPGTEGTDWGASEGVTAWASQRAPAVEQISDHGPLPVDGSITRDSVGAKARPTIAINAMCNSQRRRCLKKFTARV